MEIQKTAIITGGSDGIGLAIAKTFAEQRYNLVITGRSEHKLQTATDILKRYGTNIISWAGDLAIPGNVSLLVDYIGQNYKQVDVLVNNAGMAKFISFQDTSETMLDDHINLNIKTPYLLSQQILPLLIARKGNIINISSYFSNRMLPGRTSTAYSLTKGAIDSFTKSLAFELGPLGIRVNAIAPGTVKTAIFQANMDRLTEDKQQDFYNMVKDIYPLGHIGTPEDVAEVAVFLATEKAKWMTGTIIAVDGGLTTN